MDNEAVDVKYELVTEEELTASRTENSRGPGDSNVGVEEESNAVDEKDIFGAALSDDSDEEGTSPTKPEDSNRPVDVDSDSNMMDITVSNTTETTPTVTPTKPPLVTQFNKDMFPQTQQRPPVDTMAGSSTSTGVTDSASGGGAVAIKLDSLRNQLRELQTKKTELERNMAACDNQMLLLRFKQSLSEVESEIAQKEAEVEDLSMFS